MTTFALTSISIMTVIALALYVTVYLTGKHIERQIQEWQNSRITMLRNMSNRTLTDYYQNTLETTDGDELAKLEIISRLTNTTGEETPIQLIQQLRNNIEKRKTS